MPHKARIVLQLVPLLLPLIVFLMLFLKYSYTEILKASYEGGSLLVPLAFVCVSLAIRFHSTRFWTAICFAVAAPGAFMLRGFLLSECLNGTCLPTGVLTGIAVFFLIIVGCETGCLRQEWGIAS